MSLVPQQGVTDLLPGAQVHHDGELGPSLAGLTAQ